MVCSSFIPALLSPGFTVKRLEESFLLSRNYFSLLLISLHSNKNSVSHSNNHSESNHLQHSTRMCFAMEVAAQEPVFKGDKMKWVTKE